jgi:predicted PurR-regulated permease PerM
MNLITDESLATPEAAPDGPEDILLPEDFNTPQKPRQPLHPHTIALTIIATGVVLFFLYSARAIMFPFVLAVLIAFPLRPFMRWLGTIRVPRVLAATLVMATVLSVIVLAVFRLGAPAAAWLDDAPTKLRTAETRLRSIARPLEDLSEATQQVDAMTESADKPDTLKVEVQQPRLSSTVLSVTSDIVIEGIIALSLAFLLLVFGDDLLKSIVKVLPTRRDRRHLEQLCFDLERMISRYLLTYTVINIGLGAVIGSGLWLMGMPNPILWGAMAACLNYIPFVGLVIGSCVVFIAALLSFDSTVYALLAPTIYLVANGFEANLVTPTLLGRSMKINTIMVFISIVVWGWMWGIGGAIVAVPALAVGKIVCDRSERLSIISAILAG